jgi:hypothetical protein
MKFLPFPAFSGFHIAAVAAAVLLAYAIELLVATVNTPLSTGIVDLLNYVMRVGRFSVSFYDRPVQLPWLLTVYKLVSGIAALFLGFRLAAWAARDVLRKSAF